MLITVSCTTFKHCHRVQVTNCLRRSSVSVFITQDCFVFLQLCISVGPNCQIRRRDQRKLTRLPTPQTCPVSFHTINVFSLLILPLVYKKWAYFMRCNTPLALKLQLYWKLNTIRELKFSLTIDYLAPPPHNFQFSQNTRSLNFIYIQCPALWMLPHCHTGLLGNFNRTGPLFIFILTPVLFLWCKVKLTFHSAVSGAFNVLCALLCWTDKPNLSRVLSIHTVWICVYLKQTHTPETCLKWYAVFNWLTPAFIFLFHF